MILEPERVLDIFIVRHSTGNHAGVALQADRFNDSHIAGHVWPTGMRFTTSYIAV